MSSSRDTTGPRCWSSDKGGSPLLPSIRAADGIRRRTEESGSDRGQGSEFNGAPCVCYDIPYAYSRAAPARCAPRSRTPWNWPQLHRPLPRDAGRRSRARSSSLGKRTSRWAPRRSSAKVVSKFEAARRVPDRMGFRQIRIGTIVEARRSDRKHRYIGDSEHIPLAARRLRLHVPRSSRPSAGPVPARSLRRRRPRPLPGRLPLPGHERCSISLPAWFPHAPSRRCVAPSDDRRSSPLRDALVVRRARCRMTEEATRVRTRPLLVAWARAHVPCEVRHNRSSRKRAPACPPSSRHGSSPYDEHLSLKIGPLARPTRNYGVFERHGVTQLALLPS